MGRWAGSAIRGGVQVQLHKESQSKAQFHGSLSRVSGGANVTRVKSDQLLARSVRNIARELADDYKLTLAMETPYAELLRVAAPQEITLFEAASKPEAEPLDPLSVSVLDGGPLIRKSRTRLEGLPRPAVNGSNGAKCRWYSPNPESRWEKGASPHCTRRRGFPIRSVAETNVIAAG
ncbi:MAG: hypothetical protein U5J83_04015 [Bryobacterales bacterium]|nr:hypothetical protein [Bryobacterales bacterium]